DETQRHRVDAPALVGRCGVALSLEDVAEVAAAARASGLQAPHPHRPVRDEVDRVALLGFVERRPPAMALELRARPEELLPAGSAGVDPDRLRVHVLPGERTLGTGLAQDVV